MVSRTTVSCQEGEETNKNTSFGAIRWSTYSLEMNYDCKGEGFTGALL